MSGSTILNRWLNRLFKLIAVFLVLFAVLLSSARVLLPYADNYRVELQDYVNQRYQTDIHIAGLTIGWSGTGPNLVAQNVKLVETSGLAIKVENFGFELDFWKSILSQKIVSSQFDIQGLTADIEPDVFERSESNASVSEMVESIADIFLTQIPHVTMRNSRLLVTEDGEQRALIISALRWQNIGKEHKGEGEIIVDGVSSNNLKLQLAFTGDELDELSGKIYVEANNINVTPWLKRVLAIENDKVDSHINFQVWQTINKGLPDLLQIELGESDFVWRHNKEQQRLVINSGQIVGHYNNERQQFDFASNNISWQTNGNQHQPLAFYLEAQEQNVFSYVSQIDVAGLNKIASVVATNEQTQNLLAQLSLSGLLTDVYVAYDGQLKLSAQLEDFGNQYANGIPGTERLYASIAHRGKQTAVTLASSDGSFDFKEHFYRPIPYQALSANVQLEQTELGFLIDVNQLKLLSSELSLAGDVSIDVPKDDSPSMSLLASITSVDAKNARFYYPLKSMGKDLVNYLENSIIDGQIPVANVIYSGKFKDFPFNDNQGVFTVDAELENATFKFDKNWPEIQQLAANLNFTNNSMTITTRGGDLTGLAVDSVVARIDELKGKNILEVDALIDQQSPKHIHTLMQQSPLQDSVANVLDQVKLQKPVSGRFNLHLPLKNTEAVIASGEVKFKDNQVALQAPRMDFAKVNGVLTFKNDLIDVEQLDINWRGKPISLVVHGEKKENFYQTDIALNGLWAQEHWQGEIPVEVQSYLAGDLNWQGNLTLFNVDGGDFNYRLTLDSDLAGGHLKFPSPYTIAAEETAPFHIEAKGDIKQSTIDAFMGEKLSFYGVLAHETAGFNRAHLVLGEEKMMLPTDGFHITTKLDEAQFTQWQPFVKDIIESVDSVKQAQEGISQPLLEKPERIRGSIAKLDLWGHEISDVTFNMFDKTNWWLLQLNAKEGRSQVKFYPDWDEQGVDINIDFLNLPVGESVAEEVEDVIASSGQYTDEIAQQRLHDEKDIFEGMPPMKVHCDSCRFGLLDLGEVDFEIERDSPETVALKNFVAKRDGLNAKFDGQWLLQDDYSSTQIVGQLDIKSVEAEMNRLDVTSAIKDSGMNVNYELNWLGSPTNFDLANLNGQIKVAFDDGYVADVSEKGAKLFSLLSLRSLVRKLTLDFRDIFADGMFYSSIKGDLTIEQGVLYTDNVRMKGSAGDLTVKGNTDLVAQELDYEMLYKPNITSSLPALAWIATLNPVTFLAGIAIDEVITSSVVSEFKFVLSGTIDEPTLVQVGRKDTNISVGRSTPPQIVEKTEPRPKQDNSPEPPPAINKLPGQVTPLQKDAGFGEIKPSVKAKEGETYG